jgi:hypothetical protein
MAAIAGHRERPDRRIVMGMFVPAQVAVDAWAARAAGRSNAFLGRRQEAVRDSPWASDRDFHSAMAEPEPLLWLARRDVQQSPQVRRLRDAWQKAAYQMARPVSEVPRAVRVLSLKAPPTLLRAQPDESASLPVRWWSQVQRASRRKVPPRRLEPAPWAQLE